MRLHRFALGLAAVCYALLLLGGHVHNTHASLACGTDWPRCHGVWMPRMEGGVLLEHSHRILAAVVGLGAVVLTVWLAVAGRRRGGSSPALVLAAVGFVIAQLAGLAVFASMGARHGEAAPGDVPVLFTALALVGMITFGGAVALAFRVADEPGRGAEPVDEQSLLGWGLLAVGLVAAQGLLGALTVAVGLSPAISTAHLGTSMLFFATLLVLAIRAARLDEGGAAGAPVPLPGRARRLAWVTLGLVYVQMLLGAAVRHVGAGMICGQGFPLCMGQLWPEAAHPGVYLHIAHRAVGLLLLGHLFGVWASLRRGSDDAGVRRAALALPVLVTLQVGLGWMAVYTVLQPHVVTAHLAVAAALFADLVWVLVSTRATEAQPARLPAPVPVAG